MNWRIFHRHKWVEPNANFVRIVTENLRAVGVHAQDIQRCEDPTCTCIKAKIANARTQLKEVVYKELPELPTQKACPMANVYFIQFECKE